MPSTLSVQPRRHRCSSCKVPLHRHGDRRYRCPSCGITLRIKHRKRGPKRKESRSIEAAQFYLRGKLTVRDAAEILGVSYGTAHERIRRSIARLIAPFGSMPFRWNGSKVMLIVDALWLQCRGKRWTVYCILARHVGERDARIAFCAACPGNESYTGWRRAIGVLSPELLQSTISITSDGHVGLHAAVVELCPKTTHQRCQFHLIAGLRHRLSPRAIGTDLATKRCWDTARLILQL